MQILPKEKGSVYVAQNLDSSLKAQCVTYVNRYRTRDEMHYHDCAEFGLCTKGTGLFLSERGVTGFRQGSVTYMPPGILHIAQSRDDAPSEWIFLFADVSDMEYAGVLMREMVVTDGSGAELLRAIAAELDKQREGFGYAYRRLAELLLLRLARIAADLPDRSAGSYEFRRVVPAVNYLSGHYAEEVTVLRLATLCGMGETTFFRVFRRATGETPISYRNKLRVAAAEVLLASTALPVTQVAFEVGFGDVSSFFRQFQKLKGLSPRDFRRLVPSMNGK